MNPLDKLIMPRCGICRHLPVVFLVAVFINSWRSSESSAAELPVSYSRHKVVRVRPTTGSQLQVVHSLALSDEFRLSVSVWSEPLWNGSVDLHVAPDVYDNVTDIFQQNDISFEILIDDIERLIIEQRAEAQAHRQRRRRVQQTCPHCPRRRRSATHRRRPLPPRRTRNAAGERATRGGIQTVGAVGMIAAGNARRSAASQGTAGNARSSVVSQGTAWNAERSAASQGTIGNVESSTDTQGTVGNAHLSSASQGTTGNAEEGSASDFQGAVGALRAADASLSDTGHTERVTRAEVLEIVDHYATYDEIVDWLHVVKLYRPQLVELQVIGRSYQGLPLYVLKIGERRGSEVKPEIWIDAGIHAREWIAPATAVFFVYSLIVSYGSDPLVTSLLSEFDWYIMPIMNPDGYEYSHTTDRMWRKTRSRTTNMRRCQGVDANRNFDFQWRSDCDDYSPCRGRNPCDDVYAGRRPFSEPETIAVANWVLAHRDRLKLYLSLHSYSQLWLTPWGYTAAHPSDYDDLMSAARAAVSALQAVSHTRYKIGSPAEILYAATGGSYDWVKGFAGVKYSYTIELRDTGTYGFLLPRSQIIPTGQETWAGVMRVVQEVKDDECWMYRRNCT